MIDIVLQFIAPHHCCECDKIGTLLCEDCKYNITTERESWCLVCRRPAIDNWLCGLCKAPYDKAWAVGVRKGGLQRLIGLYKFERTIEARRPLAELLDKVLPVLPVETIIIPVPTTQSRIRERGYDHMLLIARTLAKRRGLQYKQLIRRKANTKQRQASARKRLSQARDAFIVSGGVDPAVPYLVIDDVMTTGATAKYTTKVLKDAGANHVWLAVIARQTLD